MVNIVKESQVKESHNKFKYIYSSNIEDPIDDYEKTLLDHNGERFKIKKDLGNGNYEVEFEDGSEFDIQDDEIIEPDFDGDSNGHLIDEDLGQDIDHYQEWVDYDMKHYGRISDETNRDIREAGLQIVKDKYGDYEVIAGRYDESLEEDTIQKANGKWTNRGDDGIEHGEFDTKKEADAQRKAMFAKGYKGENYQMKLKINEDLNGANPSNDYRIYTLTMEVAVPNSINLRRVGFGPDGILMNSIRKALKDRDLEMAGDWIDYEESPELTKIYKDNYYEFDFDTQEESVVVNEDESLGAAQMHFETGINFDEGDFENSEGYNKYTEYVEMGPEGFLEEFKDVFDFDPDFIREYGEDDG